MERNGSHLRRDGSSAQEVHAGKGAKFCQGQSYLQRQRNSNGPTGLVHPLCHSHLAQYAPEETTSYSIFKITTIIIVIIITTIVIVIVIAVFF